MTSLRRGALLAAWVAATAAWVVPSAHAQDEATEDEDAEEQPRDERIRYVVERVVIRGNRTTRDRVIRRYVPIRAGDVLDVEDPAVELIRYRLLGTGWFRDVRLALARGSRRGRVILRVEVEERNTLVVQGVSVGLSSDVSATADENADLSAYGAVDVGETNLLGLGVSLSAAAAISERQQGYRLRYSDRAFAGSQASLNATLLFNDARDYFGDRDVRATSCAGEEVEGASAVVAYTRAGGVFGTGLDLGVSTRLELGYRLELLDASLPCAASRTRGPDDTDAEVVPIDFGILRGRSVLSGLTLDLSFDRRDVPALPSRGIFVRFTADAFSNLLGSDYDFARLQVAASGWLRLPWGHVLEVRGFLGAVLGRAPFFFRFFVGDQSDLIPNRILDLTFDRRPAPDFLGTAVAEMRYEDLAGSVGLEYRMRLHRSGNPGAAIYGVDAYLGVGLYALGSRSDIRLAPAGYVGLSRIPLDLTFDLGLKADTSLGVFRFGLSNLIGFFPFSQRDL